MDVVVDLLLGREVGSAGRTRGARRGRARRAVPADLRRRHGQGRRGHRVLPLDPPDGPLRGRRRARAVRAHADRPVGVGGADAGLGPARHDDPVDARHEARRGHARAARGAQRAARASGRRSSTPCAPPPPRTAARCSTAARSTCSGRRWRARGPTTARSPRTGWWST